MPKTLGGSILFFVAFLIMSAILNGSSTSGSSTGVTTIRAIVLPCVEVSAPADTCIWEIKTSEPGIYTKKGSIKVAANTNWQVTVKSPDDTNAGRMTEWTGTAYTSRKLKEPLSISAERKVTLPEGGPIQTGMTAGEHDIEVTLTQVVSQDDLPLKDGHVYRISLSFEGSPVN